MNHKNPRQAFTLVEMLVVIAIMGVLFGMVVLMFPSFSGRKRANNGATQLQGWLFLAKQRAFRDGSPRGVRLLVDPTNPTQVKECIFIEQPEDYSGGTVQTGANLKEVRIGGGIDVTQGYPSADLWLVQPGDYLQVQDVGLPHLIKAIAFDAKASQSVLTLDSDLPYAIPAPGTASYRIIRAPRVTGEPLPLPDSVIIDIKTNADYGNPLPTGFYFGGLPGTAPRDVLFAPSGKVITPGTTTDFIALWVRDVTQPTVFDGNPSIIAVHVRSGLVAGHDPSGGADPYVNVRLGTSKD